MMNQAIYNYNKVKMFNILSKKLIGKIVIYLLLNNAQYILWLVFQIKQKLNYYSI